MEIFHFFLLCIPSSLEAKHVNSQVSCDICGHLTKTRKALKMHKYRQHKELV